MSEQKDKGKGLFGRFFKGGSQPQPEEVATEAQPEAKVDAPLPDENQKVVAEPIPAKANWFQRLKSGLGKTSSKLTTGITDLFSKRKLDAETIDDLEDLLIQSDLGLETTSRITAAIGKGRFEKVMRCATFSQPRWSVFLHLSPSRLS